MRTVAILSCLLAAYFAYSIYEPLPEFVLDKSGVRIASVVWKIFGRCGQVVDRIGVQWRLHSKLNALLSFLMPSPRSTASVTFSYHQFADSRTLTASPADSSRRSGAAIVLIHGGGYITGAPELYLETVKELVEALGVTVFAIRYRFAPEHPFPAAFDDSLAAVEAIFDKAESMGIDPSRIAIAGDSAGGQLTAAIVQHLRMRQSRHRPKVQVLVYPAVQFVNFRTKSMIENNDAPFLKSAGRPRTISFYLKGDWSLVGSLGKNHHVTPKMKAAFKAAVGDEVPMDADLNDQAQMHQGDSIESLILDYRVSPLLNPDIDSLELPPIFVIACEFDPLRDDALMYAKRLERAGVKVELNKYQKYHGALDMPNDGKQMRKDLVDYLGRLL